MVDRPLAERMTDDILTRKAIRRKNELIWRKTRTTMNFDIYYDSCKAVKEAISKRKSELMEQRVCCEMGRLERERQHCVPKDRLYST